MSVFKIESIILILVSVFIVAFSVLFVYAIGNDRATMQVYLLSALPVLFAVTLLIYCWTVRIVIDEYSITYITLFTTKTMAFSDVIKIDSYARGRPALVDKCKTAEIDAQTRMMIHGKMPSIFFKYQ